MVVAICGLFGAMGGGLGSELTFMSRLVPFIYGSLSQRQEKSFSFRGLALEIGEFHKNAIKRKKRKIVN